MFESGYCFISKNINCYSSEKKRFTSTFIQNYILWDTIVVQRVVKLSKIITVEVN